MIYVPLTSVDIFMIVLIVLVLFSNFKVHHGHRHENKSSLGRLMI